MSSSLFKPISPLFGVFLLLEALTVIGLIGLWIDFVRGTTSWSHWNIERGIVPVTALFICSNILLWRRRSLAIIGLIVCWFWLAAALLPVL